MPLRSSKNKHEKRTLRKKNKKRVKNKRKTVRKNNRRKRTQKKKTKINLQIGGNVEPIMARLLHTLERDVIEYLPSTKVIDTLQSEKHYIEMVDYIKLQEIINNNENFKKSPKIRKLFDYDLYEINNKDMYFIYKDFKCENIFKDVDKYYIYILYFYLMECNITRNDKIQQDGGAEGAQPKPEGELPAPEGPENPLPEDINIEDPLPEGPAPEGPAPEGPAPEGPAPEGPAPEGPAPEGPVPEEPVPEEPVPEGPSPEGPAPEEPVPEEPVPEGPSPEEPVPEGPSPEEPVPEGPEPEGPSPEEPLPMSDPVSELDEPLPIQEEGQGEDLLDLEMKENKKSIEEGEKDVNMEENIRFANEIELPGFQEYEDTRRKLDMKSSVVNGNIKITNSDLIKYKVNWFNICMGIDIFDTGFENKVSTKLEEIGIKPFKRDKYLEKINLILDDEEMTANFKNAIYERLLENCKEPEDFINNKKKCENPPDGGIDKFLGIFRTCHEQEMKNNGTILYLYDKYRTILNRNKTTINNVDMVLILLNCEIRQRILSYHISVELIRRRNDTNKTINSILDNIYEIDKPVIEMVEEELRNKIAQEKLERMKLVQEVNREEIERRKEAMMRKREPELINAILEKKKEENNPDQSGIKNEEIKKYVGTNDKNTDDFIKQEKLLLNNVAAPAAGGGQIEEGNNDDNNDNNNNDDNNDNNNDNDDNNNNDNNNDDNNNDDNNNDDNNKNTLDLESGMLESKETKNNTYENSIHNNREQEEYCSSIQGSINRIHMRSPQLLNKCKSF